MCPFFPKNALLFSKSSVLSPGNALLFLGILPFGLPDVPYPGSSPHNFRGDLKISDQNNWGGGPKQKIKFGGS